MIQVSGTLPSSMAEGSLPGDWAGLLAVTGTSGGIAAVEAIGPGPSTSRSPGTRRRAP